MSFTAGASNHEPKPGQWDKGGVFFFYISLLGREIEDGRPASCRHDHDSKPRMRGVRSSTRQGHFVFGPQLRALTESVLGMCGIYVLYIHHTLDTYLNVCVQVVTK